jgi:hypothetical protein
MFVRPIVFALALVAACLSPLAGGVARAETDVLKSKLEGEAPTRPRLVVALNGKKPLLDALKKELDGMRRFELVDSPNVKSTLKAKGITLDAKLSVEMAKKALAIANTDLILDGTIQETGGLRIACRLYDLRTGEISRDLSLIGEANDVNGFAVQLASFVRFCVPIRCALQDLNDDQVIIGVGTMDGVREGAMFKVLRYPQNLKPREIGTVRITKADPFASTGEVESTVGGAKVEPGDMLVEQTSSYILSQ